MNFTFWMKPSCRSPFTFARPTSSTLIRRKHTSTGTIHCQNALRFSFLTIQRPATNGTSANGIITSVNCTRTSLKYSRIAPHFGSWKPIASYWPRMIACLKPSQVRG